DVSPVGSRRPIAAAQGRYKTRDQKSRQDRFKSSGQVTDADEARSAPRRFWLGRAAPFGSAQQPVPQP
ncbi:MAG: hypothetical protein AAGA03_04730, partial [Planctomycetota bacterium]